MRAAVLQDAEPPHRDRPGRRSEQPADLISFCTLWFFLSGPGAAGQPLTFPISVGAWPSGPRPPVLSLPQVQHLDPDQVKVRRAEVQHTD